MGIAGIIFAVLALAFPIIPTIGWALTAISLLTGTSLSAIGFMRYREGSQEHRSAILGIAVNVAVIVVIILWIYLFLGWWMDTLWDSWG